MKGGKFVKKVYKKKYLKRPRFTSINKRSATLFLGACNNQIIRTQFPLYQYTTSDGSSSFYNLASGSSLVLIRNVFSDLAASDAFKSSRDVFSTLKINGVKISFVRQIYGNTNLAGSELCVNLPEFYLDLQPELATTGIGIQSACNSETGMKVQPLNTDPVGLSKYYKMPTALFDSEGDPIAGTQLWLNSDYFNTSPLPPEISLILGYYPFSAQSNPVSTTVVIGQVEISWYITFAKKIGRA